MRIAVGVEYNGQSYFGWQRQRDVKSIQSELERAFSVVANEPIALTCAGRTDAGVHATAQVVHFDTRALRPEGAWTMGVNSNLPDDIAVRWAQPVSNDFNARFSATGRRYRYIILNTRLRPGIMRGGVSHYHQPLQLELMQQAAPALLGEHDFSAFRAAHCQSHTPFRCLTHLTLSQQGPYIVVDIAANAFLHHMVRNIVGSLMTIGAGERPPEWLAELLAGKDRTQASATAKPNGLYLVAVDYPAEFRIPKTAPGPLWLA